MKSNVALKHVEQVVTPVIYKSSPSNTVQTIIVPNNSWQQNSRGTSSSYGHNIVHLNHAADHLKLHRFETENLNSEGLSPGYMVGHSIRVSETSNVPSHMTSSHIPYDALPHQTIMDHQEVPLSYGHTINKQKNVVPVQVLSPMFHQQSQPIAIVKPQSLVLNKVHLAQPSKYIVANPVATNNIPIMINDNAPNSAIILDRRKPIVMPRHNIMEIKNEEEPIYDDLENEGQSYTYFVSSKHH